MEVDNLDFLEFVPNFPDNDIDKVKFFLTNVAGFNFMPEQHAVKSEKCEQKAIAARNAGNRKFIEKDNLAALQAYNESLCYAPNGSECLGIAYANRSAIYLNCGFFKLCMENINLALENNYPERLMPKLVKRKEECLEKMKTVKDSGEMYSNYADLTKLSYPADPKIPFMIDGLQLNQNAKYGRFIVTNRDLKPGDVVMVEEPFVKSSYFEETEYTQCLNCCNSNFSSLKPCPKTTRVMFCSEKCSEDAWNNFYKYEWQIIDGLIVDAVLLECHIFLKAFTFFGDLIKLKEMLDSAEKDPITVFDVDFKEADEMTKYRLLFSIKVIKTKRDAYLRACYMYYMLKKFTDFKKIIKTTKMEKIFIKICVRIALIYSNHHEFSPYWFYSHNHNRDTFLSRGLFFASCLINHSCWANVRRVAMYGKNYFVVIQPIKAGEQLFDNYGRTPKRFSVEERKKSFGDSFVCDCVACTFESQNPPQQLRYDFPRGLPHFCRLMEILHKIDDCPFDESTLLTAQYAAKEIIDAMAKSKVKYSRELVEFNHFLLTCFMFQIGKKPLHSMLTPRV